ncbi:MAG: toll/interleukin-1 receptor domain-containing protein [Granulosicoccus sp.]
MSEVGTNTSVGLSREVVANIDHIGEARVFIAWSEETKDAADLIFKRLEEEELSAWLSDQIAWGAPFRKKIREAILSADLVIAVFPEEPSRWQIAEAGLAYFEQKLLPVVIDTGNVKIEVIEPFSELQVRKISKPDLENRTGESIERLVREVKEKLGEGSSTDAFVRACRFTNRLYVAGVPIAGLLIVCSLLIAGLTSTEAGRELQLWKASHTVFGAIVYGGAAFVSLIFARTGVSTSFSERQFGFRIGRRLFYLWLIVALTQFFIGLMLLSESPAYSHKDGWVFIAIISYLFSLGCWCAGYDRYRSANDADKEGKPLKITITLCFVGNIFFGLGLLLSTLVIILMSLKNTIPWLTG